MRSRDHSEVADGDFQRRAFPDDFPHLGDLGGVVGQAHGEDHSFRFHFLEHLHQRRVGEASVCPVPRDGDAAEAGREVRGVVVHVLERAAEEPVGEAFLDIQQIGVLVAVDHFLYDDGRLDLRIIHVGEEDFGTVDAVHHEGRKHLPLFAEEHRAAPAEGVDPPAVHRRVLAEPEMCVCIDEGHGLRCFSSGRRTGRR